MPFTNNDVSILYPTATSQVGNAGEYKTFGLEREIEITVNLADLTETESVITQVKFPVGKVLGKVEIIADTAAATGAAIDIGFIKVKDGVEVDYDGAVAAFPTASMNAEGKRTVLTQGVTYAGALVGKVASATDVMKITGSRTTATAFTAGRVRIKLFWYKKTSTT